MPALGRLHHRGPSHCRLCDRASPGKEPVGDCGGSHGGGGRLFEAGHVSHAFFKEAVLGRYHAICNCCSCCCGAMQAHRAGVPMLASSGYVAELTQDTCIGCGICVKKRPFSAISLGRKEKNRSHPDIARDMCLGCGVCTAHCPEKALKLVLDPAKPEPLMPGAMHKREDIMTH